MTVFHHSHRIRFLNKPGSDLMKLFFSGVSRRVSQVFLSVFSSVFIYQSVIQAGYDFKAAVLSAVGFFILLIIFKAAAIMAAEDYTRVHGFKNAMETSLLPFTISIICFILAISNYYFLIPAAIFWGIHSGFYWWGYHGYFVKSGEYENYGKELGEIGVLETVAAILAPIAGSAIVEFYGFRSVYISSFLFMLLSVFLISRATEKKQKHDVDFKEMLYLFKKHKTVAAAYFGWSIEGTLYAVIWPLFLYLFLNNILEMGTILSLAVLFAAVLGFFVGGIQDRFGGKKLVSLGTPLIFVSWLFRIFSSSIGIFVLADSFWNVGQRMIGIPMDALTYRKALEKQVARAILFRELSISFGAIFGLIVTAVVFYFSTNFIAVFVIASLFSILPLTAVLSGEFDGKK